MKIPVWLFVALGIVLLGLVCAVDAQVVGYIEAAACFGLMGTMVWFFSKGRSRDGLITLGSLIAVTVILTNIIAAKSPAHPATVATSSDESSSEPNPVATSDVYTDCLELGHATAQCVQAAKNEHYTLTPEDRNLAAQPVSTDVPKPTAPPTPKPTPDRHDERVEYQDFWNKTVGNLAMVYVCVNYASKTAATGDMVGASQLLKYGQTFADNAKTETLSDVPNGWSDSIGPHLYSASNDLSDSMTQMRDYLDTNKPSSAAEAQEQAQNATAEVESATESARESYVSMGGKSDDLQSMQSKVEGADAAFDALLSSGNSSAQ